MEPTDQPATKTDLGRLEVRFDDLEVRFDRLEDKFDLFAVEIRGEIREMHAVLHARFRTHTITMAGAMTALTAIFGVIVVVLG